MPPIPYPRRTLAGSTLLLAGLGCELLAAWYFLVPGVPFAFPVFPVHFSSAAVVGGGAGLLVTAGQARFQWLGPAVFFALLAALVPVAGSLGVIVMAVVFGMHRSRPRPETPALRAVDGFFRLPPAQPAGRFGFPGNVPLVSVLGSLDAETLQSVTLGMTPLPERQSRPILTRLRNHPDVRVQLYANGLRNEQLDTLERRLAILKRSRDGQAPDEATLTAIVETYLHLFDNELVPPDEWTTTARRALQDTALAVSMSPDNPVALAGLVRFHLILREYQDAAALIAQLRLLPGQEAVAAILEARMRCEAAAHEAVPITPVPAPQASTLKQRLA
ncbi:MAG: hypothetical protein HKO57_02710 [Akkermansiaceae bacterium]|nr:hypothetical protein [Akkermansiaceae bacterium]